MIAETKAADAKKGLHGSTPPSSSSISLANDLSSDGKKARQYFSVMQGSAKGVAYRGPATVEYVFTGSRFKILLPFPENCYLQLSLAEVRCPLMARAAPKGGPGSSGSAPASRTGEPFAEEARQFSRRRLMQRSGNAPSCLMHSFVQL